MSDVLSRYWTMVTPLQHVSHDGDIGGYVYERKVRLGKNDRPPNRACSTTCTRFLEPNMASVESVTRYSE